MIWVDNPIRYADGRIIYYLKKSPNRVRAETQRKANKFKQFYTKSSPKVSRNDNSIHKW